jgi:pyruvate dehydrogenase E1 component beta subunit
MPSTPQNAYGLLRAAIQDDDPVIVLEPRRLYGTRGEVILGDEGVVELGRAQLLAHGEDVTIVTAGAVVPDVLEAVHLASGAWSADVVDLQTIVPWDRETVLRSVARTGRLVVVEESPWSGGWGTEITSEIAAECFGRLVAPPHRITTPDVPVPYTATLENRYLPSAGEIADQIGYLVARGERPRTWWTSEAMA